MPLTALKKLLSKKLRIYIACTGGGAGLQGILWKIPGISSVLVGAEFPYGEDAFDEFLGFKPEGYCNEKSAMDLAQEAYYRAYKFEGAPALGVGLTASVATTREHRGDHRVFVASFSAERARVTCVTLRKGVGEGQREVDGLTCDLLGVNAILKAVGEDPLCLSGALGYCLPGGGNVLESVDLPCADEIARRQFHSHPFFSREGKRDGYLPPRFCEENSSALYPGNFFPAHFGHFGVAESYQDSIGGQVVFTVDSTAPNRGGLSVADLLQRAKILKGKDVLFTQGAPLYLDKARKYPGHSILIGVDAFERMLDPKWGLGIAELAKGFLESRIFFHVADRAPAGEEIRTLADVPIPPEFRGVPCYRLRGRWDISSTELREGRAVA
jgi:hypothetical protein